MIQYALCSMQDTFDPCNYGGLSDCVAQFSCWLFGGEDREGETVPPTDCWRWDDRSVNPYRGLSVVAASV